MLRGRLPRVAVRVDGRRFTGVGRCNLELALLGDVSRAPSLAEGGDPAAGAAMPLSCSPRLEYASAAIAGTRRLGVL